jgi:hypothetical protein
MAAIAGESGVIREQATLATHSEPGEEPGTSCQDTLKTSLFALPLFPTAEGPVNRHPVPHLTLVSPRF